MPMKSEIRVPSCGGWRQRGGGGGVQRASTSPSERQAHSQVFAVQSPERITFSPAPPPFPFPLLPTPPPPPAPWPPSVPSASPHGPDLASSESCPGRDSRSQPRFQPPVTAFATAPLAPHPHPHSHRQAPQHQGPTFPHLLPRPSIPPAPPLRSPAGSSWVIGHKWGGVSG